MNKTHTVAITDPSLPSAAWPVRAMLSKKMIDAYNRNKKLVKEVQNSIQVADPSFPKTSLALLQRAKVEDWLSRTEIAAFLGQVLTVDRRVEGEDQGEEVFDADDIQMIGERAFDEIVAGAYCCKPKKAVEALTLLAEISITFNILEVHIKNELKKLVERGHKPISLTVLPQTKMAFELYHKVTPIDDEDILEVLALDDVAAFNLIREITPSSKDTNNLLKLVDHIEWDQCAKIRKYTYDYQLSCPDEDAYSRILRVFETYDSRIVLGIDESAIPQGFFERHGHELWYEIFKALDRISLSAKVGLNGQHQQFITSRLECLGLVMRNSDPLPALRAFALGRSLISLKRYREEKTTESMSVRALIDFVRTRISALWDEDTPAKGFIGSMSGYLLSAALLDRYPHRVVRSSVMEDDERVLFYKISGNPAFLHGLQSKKLSSELLGQDFGL